MVGATGNRVTNSMMVRRYMNNLNTSVSLLSDSTNKISSGKEYSRLSDSPLDCARAMRVEESLYKNAQYTKTLEDVSTELASAESNLLDIIDVLSTVYEKSIKAGNGTTSESDRAVIAGEIESYMEFIVKSMNATFNDKYLFSNTNNSDTAPFEISDAGEVLFNGVNVDDIYKGTDGNYYYDVVSDGPQITDANGYLAYTDPASGDTVYHDAVGGAYYEADGTTPFTPSDPAALEAQYVQVSDPVLVSESFTRYIDVGLGMSFDSQGNVLPSTALEVSYGGLDCLGFGLDDDGMPNNVLSLLVELRDACYTEGEEFDLEHFGAVSDKLIEVKDTTNFYISNIGTRSNFIDKSISRLEDEEYNLTSLKSFLIEVDTADEIIAYKQYEFAWNAILQMGSKLIPTSLMDYVN